MKASRLATLPARIFDPAVVATPATSTLSLIDMVMPASRPHQSPLVCRRSISAAAASASFAVTVSMARVDGFQRSMASRATLVASLAVCDGMVLLLFLSELVALPPAPVPGGVLSKRRTGFFNISEDSWNVWLFMLASSDI